MGVTIRSENGLPFASKDKASANGEIYWLIAVPDQPDGYVTFPQKTPDGKWRANGGYTEIPLWFGPEFDTPEECAQWLTMMEATQ